jgi:hypothetical protein
MVAVVPVDGAAGRGGALGCFNWPHLPTSREAIAEQRLLPIGSSEVTEFRPPSGDPDRHDFDGTLPEWAGVYQT